MKANSKVFLPIARFLLILLFTYTAISKMLGHEQFAAQLSLQPQISSFAPLLSWLLPVAELLTVLFLLFERKQLIGFLSATLLMTAFTFYVGAMLLFENWIAMQLWWRYRANDVETAFDL